MNTEIRRLLSLLLEDQPKAVERDVYEEQERANENGVPETVQVKVGTVTEYPSEPGLLEKLRDSIFNGQERGNTGAEFGWKMPFNYSARDLYSKIEFEAGALYSGVVTLPDRYGREQGLWGAFLAYTSEGSRGVPTQLTEDAVVNFARTSPRPVPLDLAETITEWVNDIQSSFGEDTAVKILGRWVNAIESLLDPHSNVEIVAPCPNCGEQWIYTNRNGEDIRVSTWLIVRDEKKRPTSCECQSCGAAWAPSEWEFLARVLGAKPLEGAAS